MHEFISLDGVIDAPTWTFDYGFDPQMGEAGAVTEGCRGILLGRTTYEVFEPSWSTRAVEDDFAVADPCSLAGIRRRRRRWRSPYSAAFLPFSIPLCGRFRSNRYRLRLSFK
ncbi:MAG: hypothetical protein H0V77_06305 [Actinobacteria bacterium]|nr:hypothetical protein [Actinomycetota bacterium]